METDMKKISPIDIKNLEDSYVETAADLKEYADSRRGMADVSNILGNEFGPTPLAFTVHETTSTTDSTELPSLPELSSSRPERARRALGRGALSRMIKGADAWLTDKTMAVAGKLWFAPSKEELKARSQRHREKYARNDGDSSLRAAYKAAQRNRIKAGLYGAPLYTLGYFALSKGTMSLHEMTGIDIVGTATHAVVESYDKVTNELSDLYNYSTGPREVTIGQELAANAIDYTPVETSFSAYSNKAILIGGRGDTHSAFLYNALNDQGAVDEASLVEYPASIAPVDPIRMDVSTEIAANGAANFYDPNNPAVQTIFGYSEGSGGAIDAYNRIVAANGGVKPDNLELVVIGSPYAQGGLFRSDYAGAAGPILDAFGIPTDKQVPAGATIIYSPNDFWANGDNQSFLGLASMMADLGGSGHDPVVSGQFKEWVDSDGVRHLVKADSEHALVELAQKNNIPLPQGASELLQQIAPINDGSSSEVPQPNAYAAYSIAGDIINRETNSAAGTILMNNIPGPIKDASQSGLDLINNAPNTIAGIANGTIDPKQGMEEIKGQVQDFVGDTKEIFQDPAGTITEMADGSIRDSINSGIATLPPDQQAMVQPWADLGTKISDRFFGDLADKLRQPHS